MPEPLVTAQQLANVMGCTARAVRNRARKERWAYMWSIRQGGKQMAFPVRLLPEDARAAWIAHEADAVSDALPPAPVPDPEDRQMALFDDGPASTLPSRRKQAVAMAKADVLRLYLAALKRAGRGQKMTARERFVAAFNSGIPYPHLFELVGEVSWKTIEGWKRAVKTADDTLALVDRRGMAIKGRSGVTDEQLAIVVACACRPQFAARRPGDRPMIAEAIRQAVAVMEECGIENGLSESTYRRALQGWIEDHHATWVFCRDGETAFNDQCARDIERNYDLIQVGDILVADGHVLNFEVLNPWTGKPKRMSLILWYDMKSNMPCGWEIMPVENVQAIHSGLRRAILFLGKIPKVAYVDNGKAFRARHFTHCPPFDEAGFAGLYHRLGIQTIHAWPYHGQSKTVERFFGTFAELERWMPTYVGTSIDRQPPRLHRGERMHRRAYEQATGGRCITLEEAHAAIADWFDAYARRPQRGHLAGRSPLEVFMAGRGPGVDEEALRHLMMSHEVRRIDKNGIRFLGRTYWHDELFSRRHPVEILYDLQDPSNVLVYDTRGAEPVLLCTAHDAAADRCHPAARILGTEADVAQLERRISEKGRQRKHASGPVRRFLEGAVLPEHRRMLEASGIEGREIGLPSPEKAGSKRIAEAPITAEEEARIMAEAEAMDVESAADARRRLEDMAEADRYEAVLEMEARGELVGQQWQAFCSYFEQTPAYREQAEYYEERKAVFATMYQSAGCADAGNH